MPRRRKKITTAEILDYMRQHPELDSLELARELDISRGTLHNRLAEIGESYKSVRARLGLPPARDARLLRMIGS